MKSMFRMLAFLLCLSFLNSASAETKEELVKFVDDAVAYAQKEGPEKAFAKFNDKADPMFHKGELYIYVYDFAGKCLAHGLKPELIGRDSMKIQDKKGNLVTKLLIDAAKGSNFTEFYWPHPVKGDTQKKLAYAKDVGGKYLIGSGIYMGK